MKCPRCVQHIHRAAETCPQCGFSLADADALFGREDVMLRLLTDGAGLMKKKEKDKVEAAMERFSRKFPQLFLSVYTGTLGETANIRQFGFWLLNRAAFENLPPDKPNEAGILLTIDPESKSAGIVFGYLLDPYLEEADTFECLSRAHSYWLDGRHAEGIMKAFAQLEKILAKRVRQARRDPEAFRLRVAPPAMAKDLVRKIRHGHRIASPAEQETEVAQ